MIDRHELAEDIKSIQLEIDDDCRIEFDDEPGIQYTLACNDDASEFARQTGDNSYTGSAYFLPHWAVCGIYRDSDPLELADDLIEELNELIP